MQSGKRAIVDRLVAIAALCLHTVLALSVRQSKNCSLYASQRTVRRRGISLGRCQPPTTRPTDRLTAGAGQRQGRSFAQQRRDPARNLSDAPGKFLCHIPSVSYRGMRVGSARRAWPTRRFTAQRWGGRRVESGPIRTHGFPIALPETAAAPQQLSPPLSPGPSLTRLK